MVLNSNQPSVAFNHYPSHDHKRLMRSNSAFVHVDKPHQRDARLFLGPRRNGDDLAFRVGEAE
jgi:hypothetical protein